jgi:hypothetical protein
VSRRTDAAIKPKSAKGADTIFPEGLKRAHFNSFVASETSEIVAGKIEGLLARVGELGPGFIYTRNHRERMRGLLAPPD